MSGEITGIFLSFQEKELDEIKRRLDLFGYKPDGEGLKELIVDTLCDMEKDKDFESPTDKLINTASRYLEQNPEHILIGLDALKSVARMIKRRKK